MSLESSDHPSGILCVPGPPLLLMVLAHLLPPMFRPQQGVLLLVLGFCHGSHSTWHYCHVVHVGLGTWRSWEILCDELALIWIWLQERKLREGVKVSRSTQHSLDCLTAQGQNEECLWPGPPGSSYERWCLYIRTVVGLCTPALLGLPCLQESVVPRVGLLAYAVGMPLAFTPGRPFGSLGPAPACGAAVVDDFLHSVMSHPCLVICATQQTT